jgi:hypothetical protein
MLFLGPASAVLGFLSLTRRFGLYEGHTLTFRISKHSHFRQIYQTRNSADPLTRVGPERKTAPATFGQINEAQMPRMRQIQLRLEVPFFLAKSNLPEPVNGLRAVRAAPAGG